LKDDEDDEEDDEEMKGRLQSLDQFINLHRPHHPRHLHNLGIASFLPEQAFFSHQYHDCGVEWIMWFQANKLIKLIERRWRRWGIGEKGTIPHIMSSTPHIGPWRTPTEGHLTPDANGDLSVGVEYRWQS
jgi:hypothetical protein